MSNDIATRSIKELLDVPVPVAVDVLGVVLVDVVVVSVDPPELTGCLGVTSMPVGVE